MLVVALHAMTPIFAVGSDLFWSGTVSNIPALFKSIALIYWFSEDIGQVLQLPEIWATATSAFSRFENLLNTSNHNKAAQTTGHSNRIDEQTSPIVFDNASIAPAEERRAVLVGVTMSIPRGAFTIIAGRAGSGKTSFSRAIIGRATRIRGHVNVAGGKIGYCSQDDWLLNKSVRQNIVGYNRYDETWYTSVVRACVLSEDIASLVDTDEFIVGPLGANLEHHTRQKIVSLAPQFLLL